MDIINKKLKYLSQYGPTQITAAPKDNICLTFFDLYGKKYELKGKNIEKLFEMAEIRVRDSYHFD